MKSESNTVFELDREYITQIMKEKGEYRTDDVIIKLWDGGSGDTFLGKINKGYTKFVGVLNSAFDKDGYGMYEHENGDKYLGNFKDDQRNYNGFYLWPSTKVDNRVLTESYYGFFKNNKKDKIGIYMWLDEQENNTDFDEANFNAYVGEFENGTFKRGTLLQKKENSYHLYHGNFDKYGKKNDENGYFYSSQLDRLFHGKIENDKFVKGYVAFFDSEEGVLENITFCEYGENNKILSAKLYDEFGDEEKEKEVNENTLFRNIILGVDYFGTIYNNYKDIVRCMEDNMGEFDIFEDKEKFPELMRYLAAYYKNNVYCDIEEKQFGRKVI